MQQGTNSTTMHSDFGKTTPWQTSDHHVGAYAYSDCSVFKLAAVAGFTYAEGNGCNSKSRTDPDPSWQRAVSAIESNLEDARSIIRHNRHIFRLKDRFGDSCHSVNSFWIPKMNAQISSTGYVVDCVPISVKENSRKVSYVFIRISKRDPGSVVTAPPPLIARGSASVKSCEFHGEASSYMSAREYNRMIASKAHCATATPILSATFQLEQKQKELEEKLKDLSVQLKEEKERSETQATEIARLLELLQEETERADGHERRIEDLQDELAARRESHRQQMEELVSQLREERLTNEQQAEQVSSLEHRLQTAQTELGILRRPEAMPSEELSLEYKPEKYCFVDSKHRDRKERDKNKSDKPERRTKKKLSPSPDHKDKRKGKKKLEDTETKISEKKDKSSKRVSLKKKKNKVLEDGIGLDFRVINDMDDTELDAEKRERDKTDEPHLEYLKRDILSATDTTKQDTVYAPDCTKQDILYAPDTTENLTETTDIDIPEPPSLLQGFQSKALLYPQVKSNNSGSSKSYNSESSRGSLRTK